MKVLLVQPKAYGDYPGAKYPHLGLAYLASLLSHNHIDVKIIDMRLGVNLESFLSLIQKFSPDLIGISSYSMQFGKTRDLINKIKEHTSCKVLVGGPHVSAVRSSALRTTKADFGVKGEGEYTLLKLCESLERGSDGFSEIKGLIWRKGNNVIENGDRSFIKVLDTLPFPDFDKFELVKYTCYEEKRLPIITSRGCPHRCTFCSVRLCMGQNFRPRSPENVVDELEHWYRKGWRNFDFSDDCFNFDLKRAKKICDLIIERNIEISWQLNNGVRVDKVDKELLLKLKKAGCIHICYGVESGNKEVLRAIRKGISKQKVLNATKMTEEVGIDSAAFFSIGHPTETFEKAMETLRFAKSLPVSFFNFFNLIPYPGTELMRYAEEHGTFLYDKDTYLESLSSQTDNPIFETNEFSAKERKKAIKMGHSIARKKMLQYRMGKLAGYLFWQISRLNPVKIQRIYRRFVYGSRKGRKIYNLIKKSET